MILKNTKKVVQTGTEQTEAPAFIFFFFFANLIAKGR